MRGFWNILIVSLVLGTISPVLATSALLAGDDAGTNLRWKPGVIRVAVSASLLRESSNVKRDSDVTGAIKRSIETWSRVANIDFQEANSDKLSASPSGAAGDGISLITIAQTSENVLLFAKDPESAAATTRIFYNRRGLITEADIVLNPYQQFSTDGTLGTFDLESTLTHEIGHLLGLTHSSVLGSTMHANYARNGVFGLQSFSSRTLSADDIAAVRAIYGVRGADLECCGNIDGRISVSGKQNRNIEVWIEDVSGRVHGYTKASAGGEFHLAGLNEGKYRVFAHETSRTKNALPVQEIGTAVVTTGETAVVNARAIAGVRDLELSYLGFNGQLSEMAVTLSPGRSYMVYLGGRNLDPRKLDIRFTSPKLYAIPGSLRSLDYGDEISVITFEVRVGRRAAKGEYSIYVESDRGDRRAIVGGITVDSFANPWTSFSVFDD
jgi:hypothetical protein